MGTIKKTIFKILRFFCLACATVLGLATIIATESTETYNTPHIDAATYQLKITGLVENPVSYSYNDVVNKFTHYKKIVSLSCVDGWTITPSWEGMLVRDIIKEAQPLSSVKVIIFKCYDGDSTSYPIDYVMNYDMIMAYKMDGAVLPDGNGFPFQVVAEDKWGYKWAKWVTEIELSDDENYLGYWESMGYNNDGFIYNCAPGPESYQPQGHTARTDCCTCHSLQ
jgi:DMSO/TMAO reductase YedYZ molybdopterin-dependent catalytic subunit